MTVWEIKGKLILLDDVDAERLQHWYWHVIPQNQRQGKWRVRGYETDISNRQFLHRVVMGVTDPAVEIDHIDGNTLNNCRSNLRVLDRYHNQHNRGKNRNNKSGYKGVSAASNRPGQWVAQIGISGCKLNLGNYDTALEAAHAYDTVAKEWYGEHARCNF